MCQATWKGNLMDLETRRLLVSPYVVVQIVLENLSKMLRMIPDQTDLLTCVDTFLQLQVSSTFFISKIMFYSVIGLVVAVNIAIVVIGWPYAYGEFQAYPSRCPWHRVRCREYRG